MAPLGKVSQTPQLLSMRAVDGETKVKKMRPVTGRVVRESFILRVRCRKIDLAGAVKAIGIVVENCRR